LISGTTGKEKKEGEREKSRLRKGKEGGGEETARAVSAFTPMVGFGENCGAGKKKKKKKRKSRGVLGGGKRKEEGCEGEAAKLFSFSALNRRQGKKKKGKKGKKKKRGLGRREKEGGNLRWPLPAFLNANVKRKKKREAEGMEEGKGRGRGGGKSRNVFAEKVNSLPPQKEEGIHCE